MDKRVSPELRPPGRFALKLPTLSIRLDLRGMGTEEDERLKKET
jgi:hypothetical protein